MNPRQLNYVRTLNCPFCDVPPTYKKLVHMTDDYEECFICECDVCGLSREGEYFSEAVRAWNDRADNQLDVDDWNSMDELQYADTRKLRFIDVFGKIEMAIPNDYLRQGIDILTVFVGWSEEPKEFQ